MGGKYEARWATEELEVASYAVHGYPDDMEPGGA